jgi:hypothetical protein
MKGEIEAVKMEGVMVATLAVQRGRNQVVEDEKQQLGEQVLHGPSPYPKQKKKEERDKRKHDDWFIWFFTKLKQKRREMVFLQ